MKKIKLYHMSETLKLGDELMPDYLNKSVNCEPYISSMEKGLDSLELLLEKKIEEQQEDWNDVVKWCVEGIFEYIRKNEFPDVPSRTKSNYYFDNLDDFAVLYQAGWAQEPEEERNKLHLYEIEIYTEHLYKFDMSVFDKAYDKLHDDKDLESVIIYARNYFEGKNTEKPVWEIMSDSRAKAVKDISDYLKKCVEV
ncbi:MAG: hypothetical protein E7489_02435 [Ruminococcaceae bacterium]|nr:hypothetical protein [Oscillospiraceae bacterium]